MKYINADRLKAKLDEHYRKYQSMYMETRTPYTQGLIDALDLAEQAIDSLQQEQPSLPPDLDEAAKEIAYNVCKQLPNGEEKDNIVYYAILAAKAGAEWMAEQGETQEHFVIGTIADSPCGPAIVCYTDEFEIGDKVIVQIRKKY